MWSSILAPRLGAEWIGRIPWLPRAPLGPIFMTLRSKPRTEYSFLLNPTVVDWLLTSHGKACYVKQLLYGKSFSGVLALFAIVLWMWSCCLVWCVLLLLEVSWYFYTLSEAWSGVNWADLMAAQGAFGTDFFDKSTRTIVGKMLWTEYRPVIKVGPGQPWDPLNSLRSKPRTEYRYVWRAQSTLNFVHCSW